MPELYLNSGKHIRSVKVAVHWEVMNTPSKTNTNANTRYHVSERLKLRHLDNVVINTNVIYYLFIPKKIRKLHFYVANTIHFFS